MAAGKAECPAAPSCPQQWGSACIAQWGQCFSEVTASPCSTKHRAIWYMDLSAPHAQHLLPASRDLSQLSASVSPAGDGGLALLQRLRQNPYAQVKLPSVTLPSGTVVGETPSFCLQNKSSTRYLPQEMWLC